MRRFDKNEHIERVNMLMENRLMGMFNKRKSYAKIEKISGEIVNIKRRLTPESFNQLYWSPAEATNTELYGGDEKMAKMMVKKLTKEFIKDSHLTYLLVSAHKWLERFIEYEYEKDGFIKNLSHFIDMAHKFKNGQWDIDKTTINGKPYYYSTAIAKETPEETYQFWHHVLDEMISSAKKT